MTFSLKAADVPVCSARSCNRHQIAQSRTQHSIAAAPQVLFCTLTTHQRDLYKSFLASSDVSEILEGRRQALAGIDILRKICNHPDLLERGTHGSAPDYGNPTRCAFRA